jgi:hypothetical protein
MLVRSDVRVQVVLDTPATPESRPLPDALLTVAEAAERLHVTTGWLHRNWKTIPGVRKLSHRQLRFSASGLERWQRMRQTT